MRAIFGVAVAVTVVMVLASYAVPTGAEPVRQFAHDYSNAELQTLRQQYVALAEKRGERMSGPELRQGIVEMRRQYLIAELANLAKESQDDSIEQITAGIASAVLNATSRTELAEMIRSLHSEIAKVDSPVQ